MLMRLEGDLPRTMLDGIAGKLDPSSIGQSAKTALGVVMTAEGYPGAYTKGVPITGISEADALPGVKVFHGGTTIKEGALVSSGGRVLCVTALGDDLEDAQRAAYAGVEKIRMDGGFYRKDIGQKGINRLKGN